MAACAAPVETPPPAGAGGLGFGSCEWPTVAKNRIDSMATERNKGKIKAYKAADDITVL
jgi:hypothetical protein